MAKPIQRLAPFSIYIHWPYCESKCTYCNFNKYVQPSRSPDERLKNAMVREMDYYKTRYQLQSRPIRSVYFGGGTPSLAEPSTLGSILTTLAQTFNLSYDIEITMEANPTSMPLDRLQAFRDIGINRLSLGIQSFNDLDLQRMGRDHSAAQGIRAIAAAKRAFDNITFDLIFARPGQKLVQWEKELKFGLDLAGDHVSLYQLALERGTPLQKAVAKGDLPQVPDQDEAADMYEATVELAAANGFRQYEVSNYSRNPAAIGRHNFAYWQGLDYLGIGPGAHGRVTDPVTHQRVRTFGEFHPDKYIALCEAEGEGLRKTIPIDVDQTKEELVVFGLRTRAGIPHKRFEALTQSHLHQMLNQEALAMCIDSGFLIQQDDAKDLQDMPPELLSEWSQGGIRPTQQGLARMDSILPMLLHK